MTTLELPVHATPRQNARSWGNRFTSRWIEPGIVSYEDSGGDKELLRKETIDRYCDTFIGRPVVIKHRKVTPQTMENMAQGYITRVWFEPADGWFYCEGIITGDEAKDRIDGGWSVSCSYHVTATKERPGSYHAIPYVREITAFDGEHLAIVENPRYEGATIRLNSKPKKETTVKNLFKLFRKSVAAPRSNETPPAKDPKSEAPASHDNEIKGDTLIEVADGKTASISELVERYNAKPSDSEELSPESTIEVAPGKLVTLKDLVERYNDVKPYGHPCVKRNEGESDEDYKARCNKFDEDEKDKKDNSDEDKKDNSRKESPNVQSFRVLAAAASNVVQSVDRSNSADTESERLQRGRERYGSAKPGNN